MNEIDNLLLTIRQQLETLPDFGQLQFHLKKHLGNFSNTDLVKVTSIKFTDNDPNVTATTAIFQMIKAIQDSEETGTLTFSLNFKHGKAEQMQVQDFRKI